MLLIFIFTFLTTLTLVLGLTSMASGRKISRKFGTKLMSLRIIFQTLVITTLAILCFVSAAYQ